MVRRVRHSPAVVREFGPVGKRRERASEVLVRGRAAVVEIWREHVGRGREVTGKVVGRETGLAPGLGREWHHWGVGETPAGSPHKLHLVNSLGFASFILKPHLNHSHGESCLFGELLTNLSGRLWVLVETVFKNFELFRLDCRSWSSTLSVFPFCLTIIIVLVGVVPRGLGRLGLVFDVHVVGNFGRVEIEILVGRFTRLVGHIRVFDVVNFTEQVSTVVAAHLIPFREIRLTITTREAVSVEQRLAYFPRFVGFGEH